MKPQPAEQADTPIRSIVTIERPAPEALARCNRAEKYRVMRENSVRVREQLLAWIDQRGISNEVAQVSEPTVFNTLFLVATRRATELIAQAPGVVSIAEDSEIITDLPRRSPPV
ncbi:MAG: hypothetical protein HXY39_07775 [Chloroflexi bacterium]|nr:hypothetical protein [Chloroflexota bacterium]